MLKRHSVLHIMVRQEDCNKYALPNCIMAIMQDPLVLELDLLKTGEYLLFPLYGQTLENLMVSYEPKAHTYCTIFYG